MPGNRDLVPSDVKFPKDIRVEQKVRSLYDAMRVAQERLQIERQGDSLEDPDPDPYGYVQEIENQHNLDILPDNWKANPDDDKWLVRVRRRNRKAAIARFYLMGWTTHNIAQKMKCSESTVINDIKAISAEWRRSYLDDIEVLAARDLARLDEMIMRLSKGIERGDPKAIATAVEVIRERGNILGYRHGVSVDIEQHIREIASSQGMDPDTAVTLAQRISIRYKG